MSVDDRVGNISKMRADGESDAYSSSVERRSDQDRRRDHLKAFTAQFVNPRRSINGRRETDSHGFCVDMHEPELLVVVLATLSLCVVDVYATLTLLQRGGSELNPIMRVLIEADVWWFFTFKYVVTAGGLLVLLSYKNFRLYKKFSGIHTLYGILVVYILLVIYEVRLLALAMG